MDYETLSERFNETERTLLAKMKKAGCTELAIAKTNYQGGSSALLLHSDGSWSVSSAMGGYHINNPLLEKLLEKYAKLTDHKFLDQVGSYDDRYDCQRVYLNDLQRFLDSNRKRLLTNMLNDMVSVELSLLK